MDCRGERVRYVRSALWWRKGKVCEECIVVEKGRKGKVHSPHRVTCYASRHYAGRATWRVISAKGMGQGMQRCLVMENEQGLWGVHCGEEDF